MASVRASTRVSISWDGAAPYEDTDTLVLTVQSFSLDLRVFNTGPEKGTIDWSTVAKVSETAESTPGKSKSKFIVAAMSGGRDVVIVYWYPYDRANGRKPNFALGPHY
jgi:hypothetical protein